MKCSGPKFDGTDLGSWIKSMLLSYELATEDSIEVVLIDQVSDLTAEGKEAS